MGSPRRIANSPSARDTAKGPASLPGERIQKLLSRAGVASRRQAEKWLAEGRVSVNGQVVTRPGTRIDPERDHVKVDGKKLPSPRRHVYYLLHKPDGYVTTRKDPQGRPIVMDLLRGVHAGVYPVGRLDYHTTGLLLLTNDGDLADRMMRPAGGCSKVYRAKVRGIPTPQSLARLASGVVMEGRRTLPCRVKAVGGEPNAWIEVVLTEGRRNQIRKMCDAIGHPVQRLVRTAIGPLKLQGLATGQSRSLTETELRNLRETLS